MAVTRFAPSPTGYLHVGGARTALFNWLWTRHTGGKFILRIEDTDIKRNTPTATQQVINDLRWLGIDWDEGPEIGGPNGPYLQSQRKDIYDKYVKKLIDEAKAYYCFDTPEQLNALRKEAEAQKSSFIYPRPSAFPTEDNVKKARANGQLVTVRFVVPQDKTIVVQDIVRGDVTFAPGEFSDFIIQKSDGFPTYNFACVVDDYLMKITHVIRGQEHLMNTPGQQTLWQALEFGDLPKYAHMSVTVSDTGGKLSKREKATVLREELKRRGIRPFIDIADAISGVTVLHKFLYKNGTLAEDKARRLADFLRISAPSQRTQAELRKEALGRLHRVSDICRGRICEGDLSDFLKKKTNLDLPVVDNLAKFLDIHLPEINIVDFFRSGYLPETMVNFLALLGWNPGDDREIMQLEELVEAFDLSRLTKANSLFDRSKLLAFNTEHIRMTPDEKFLQHFKDYLKVVGSPVISANDELLARIIKLCEGARTLAQIEAKSRFLFIANDQIEYDEKAAKKVLLKNDGLAILRIVRDKLAAMEQFTEQNIENMLRSLAEEKQVGLGKVAQPLRVAICGTTISLPIFDSVEMLGKENALARIRITLKKFEMK